MKFNLDFINKVSELNNIVDIVSNYSQLKRTGSDGLTGICPFPDHNEKTPSFSVSEGQQVYHCFGCKKSGNIYHFVQAMQGMNFPEAVEFLADRAGVEIPKQTRDSYQNANSKDDYTKKREQKNTLYKVNRLIVDFYHKKLLELPANHQVKKYCQSRGLTLEIISEFEIGYAPDLWDSLLKQLESQNVPVNFGKSLGVLKEKSQVKAQSHASQKYYDTFRNRLMFPIVSHTEKAVGFGGRVLGDDNPKYINSSESLIFHKGQILYGLNKSAKYIKAKDWVIVVEGYMDFLALYSQGITNVVATLGTALTKEHCRLIKRYSKRLILLFDGDKAGIEAAERSLPTFFSEGLMPKACFLPNKLDPDDFIKDYGVDELKKSLQLAPDLFLLIIKKLVKDFSGQASEKVHIMNQLDTYLQAITDERLKELYVKDIADYLKVEPSWVVKMGSSSRSSRSSRSFRSPMTANINTSTSTTLQQEQGQKSDRRRSLEGTSKAELYLLNLALQDPQYFTKLLDLGIVQKFVHTDLQELLTEAALLDQSKSGKISAILMDKVDEKSRALMSWHMEEPMVSMVEEKKEQLFVDCCNTVEKVLLKKQAQQISKEIQFLGPQSYQVKFSKNLNEDQEVKTSVSNEKEQGKGLIQKPQQSASDQTNKLEQFMNIQKSRLSFKEGN